MTEVLFQGTFSLSHPDTYTNKVRVSNVFGSQKPLSLEYTPFQWTPFWPSVRHLRHTEGIGGLTRSGGTYLSGNLKGDRCAQCKQNWGSLLVRPWEGWGELGWSGGPSLGILGESEWASVVARPGWGQQRRLERFSAEGNMWDNCGIVAGMISDLGGWWGYIRMFFCD